MRTFKIRLMQVHILLLPERNILSPSNPEYMLTGGGGQLVSHLLFTAIYDLSFTPFTGNFHTI
jgi:hypothetical protein